MNRRWGERLFAAVLTASVAAAVSAGPVAAQGGGISDGVANPWFWLIFAAVVIVICVLAIPRIVKWQRRTQRIFYRIELENEGNVPSRYHLRAVDPTDTLTFKFLFNGMPLYEQFEAVSYGYDGTGAAGGSPAYAMPGMPAMPGAPAMPKVPKIEAPKVEAPKAGAPAAAPAGGGTPAGAGMTAQDGSMGGSAAESGNIISDLFNTIGVVLPGPLGSFFRGLAGKVRWGGFLANRAGEIPKQLKAVGGLVKKPPKAPKLPPVPAVPGVPAGVPAVGGAATAPVQSGRTMPQAGAMMQAWSLTPTVAPRKQAVVDLMIEPKVVFGGTQYCPFTVISRCAEYGNAPFVTDESSLQFQGLSLVARFGPYLGLGAGIIVLLLLFLAIF